jgi:hypothetical protein
MTFLEKTLPDRGYYCVAIARNPGFSHHWFETLDDALGFASRRDERGQTVYLAQATFEQDVIDQLLEAGASRGLRKQENALHLQSFFLDIDCGEDKPYADQREGAAALNAFCEQTGLPAPAVVNSGTGLYAHWPLTAPFPARQWKTVASILKNVCAAYEFHVDPARTSDSASILRPLGSTNRKQGERTVTLLRDAEPLDVREFAAALGQAAKRKKVRVDAIRPPKAADINDEFNLTNEYPDAYAERIADKCPQITAMRDSGGDIAEPVWYNAIGVLRFCVEAPQIIHDWSQEHPDYSPGDTDEKIDHHVESGSGPTTCHHFGDINPQGCLGCPHKDKIKSPITLGRKPVEQPVVAGDDSAPPPPGYVHTENGVYYVGEDDVSIQVYDHDLYPDRLAWDDGLGYETVVIRHHLPFEGWVECTMRSSLVNDPKNFFTFLWDNHIKIAGGQARKHMVSYMEGYLKQLQAQRAITRLTSQMGWTETRHGLRFVLGEQIIDEKGDATKAALSAGVPDAAKAFTQQGDLETWSAATTVLGEKGMEPLAFALLAGAFGAPLMRFTGFDGAMLSLVGRSGVGKSLILRMIHSVWGNPGKLMLLREDTRNFLVSRLGTYGSLPLTVDELTNIDPQELSALVYRVTQGRDKGRLTKSAKEVRSINTWNTLAVCSSNSSLAEKLGVLKSDASAELNRIFEYHVTQNPALDRQRATGLYRTIEENHGHAGLEYARYLIKNADRHREMLDKITRLLDAKLGATGEERFWSAVAAVAVYGGLIAKKLGLIRFDIQPVVQWLLGAVKDQQSGKRELAVDPVSVLGQFIDDHIQNRLILKVGKPNTAGLADSIIHEPRGNLYLRQEVDTQRLYISRNQMRQWLAKRHASYRELQNALVACGALKDANRPKNLGANSHQSGTKQPCWVIDLTCPELGHITATLVKDVEVLGETEEK